VKGWGNKKSYTELLAENKELKKENEELKKKLCKCAEPTSKEINTVAPPPPVVEGNVVSAADLHNI